MKVSIPVMQEFERRLERKLMQNDSLQIQVAEKLHTMHKFSQECATKEELHALIDNKATLNDVDIVASNVRSVSSTFYDYRKQNEFRIETILKELNLRN